MMEAPYHYQFRIIVIGDTMVGKSSLLKTFSEGSFGETEPTVGVDFFSKYIQIKPRHHRSKREQKNTHSHESRSHYSSEETIIVKLQIWDTAGQERFKSIVTSYYRNSVGIVLVYDVTNRESYDHLTSWFHEACRHVEPCPSPTLSPITHEPPNLINTSSHPLTSTPNVTQNDNKSVHTRINGYNDQNQTYCDSYLEDLVGSPRSQIANSTRCDNSSLSFNSVLSHLESSQQGKANKYKMAYLVIGCKTDLEKQRQVSYEDGLAFAMMHGFKFIETSSKTYYNVNQAFQLLAEEIYDRISESGRMNQLHRTPSGSHLTFATAASSSAYMSEGIRIGPLIESSIRERFHDRDRICLLEAQPISGFLGGCC